MPFDGKATYSAGATLPELAEDVSDIISIISPHETPLLDHLGSPHRNATSTVHEWLEDALLPNTDVINDDSIGDPLKEIAFDVANSNRFKVGDQIMVDHSSEVMFVTNIAGQTVIVQRGYGTTTSEPITDGDTITILGNAALEGDAAPKARFTNRMRRQNFTQIFTSSVDVSGSQLAAQSIGIANEVDYQKQERIRELLRDLENSVVNGVASAVTPHGDAGTRRTMQGIRASIASHVYQPGVGPMPAGGGNGDELSEELLNAALREVWATSAASIDTIVCGGMQKRAINNFVSSMQRYAPEDSGFRRMVDVYESDFGVCRVVMSRWLPSDMVLLLDSSRIDVMPLNGRSFHYQQLATTGDAVQGQLIGEYTVEFRNEAAHATLSGLAA